MTTENSESSTQERVLAAARTVFARRGYEHSSMAAIAKAAGVARATVYNNFADKLEILSILIGRYMRGYIEIGQRLIDSIDDTETVFEHLEALLREGLLWRAANADLRPTLELAKHMKGSGWRQATEASDQVWLDWILIINKAASKSGCIRPDLDIELATQTSFAMFDSTLSTIEVAANTDEFYHLAHQVALLQWYAVFSIPPEKSPRMTEILSQRQITLQAAKIRRLAAAV